MEARASRGPAGAGWGVGWAREARVACCTARPAPAACPRCSGSSCSSRAPPLTGHAGRDLGGQHVGVVVDGPAVDEQALRHARDLLVEARHDVGHGLDEGDLQRAGVGVVGAVGGGWVWWWVGVVVGERGGGGWWVVGGGGEAARQARCQGCARSIEAAGRGPCWRRPAGAGGGRQPRPLQRPLQPPRLASPRSPARCTRLRTRGRCSPSR